MSEPKSVAHGKALTAKIAKVRQGHEEKASVDDGFAIAVSTNLYVSFDCYFSSHME